MPAHPPSLASPRCFQVEAFRAQRALQCLPALGATLEWSRKLAGRPAAAPLVAMLGRFEERLRGQLAAYVEERVGAIQRWALGVACLACLPACLFFLR